MIQKTESALYIQNKIFVFLHGVRVRTMQLWLFIIVMCMCKQIWHIHKGRFHRFQSNQQKTRENIFHYFLPQPGFELGPFNPESSALPSRTQ